MKKHLSFVALSLLVFQSAQAAPWMEDAITNAAVGSNLGSAAPWGSSSSQIKVASGNLTNSALLALYPAGNMASIAGTGGGSSYRAFTSSAVASGAVYYSFLVQCTSLPTSGDKYLTGLLPSGTTSPGGSSDPLAVYAKVSGTGYQMGIRKSQRQPPTPRPFWRSTLPTSSSSNMPLAPGRATTWSASISTRPRARVNLPPRTSASAAEQMPPICRTFTSNPAAAMAPGTSIRCGWAPPGRT